MSHNAPTTPKRTRAEISRANGAKSKGPVTLLGKAASSRNAVRHGLTSKEVVLPDESEPAYRALRRAYFDHYSPRNIVERDLVTMLAATRWRLRRLVSIETSYLAHEIDQSLEKLEPSKRPASYKRIAWTFSRVSGRNGLPLIARYEGILQRSFERTRQQLQELRAQPIRNFEYRTQDSAALVAATAEGTNTSALHSSDSCAL